VIVVLPTMVTLGPGHGWIESVLSERSGYDVTFDRLNLGWFSSQRVSGLRLSADDMATQLDVELDSGLVDLWSGLDAATITVRGHVDYSALPTAGSTTEVGSVPPLPIGYATMRFDGLSLQYKRANQPTVTIEDITGQVSGGRNEPLEVALQARSTIPEMSGQWRLSGTVANAFDSAGRPTFDALLGGFELTSDQLHLGDHGDLRDLSIVATTTDILSAVRLELNGVVQRPDGESPLTGWVEIRDPLSARPSGSELPLFGAIQTESLPVGLLQPLLAGTSIVLARDCGPFLNVRVGADAESGQFEGEWSCDRWRGSAQGMVRPDRTLHCDQVSLSGQLTAELLKSFGVEAGDATTVIELDVVDATIPLDGPAPWGRAIAEGQVSIPQGSIHFSNQQFKIDQFHSTFKLLAGQLSCNGAARIDGGDLRFDLRSDDIQGPLDGWWPAGEVTWSEVPAERLMAASPDSVRKEVRQWIGLPADLKLVTSDAADRHATLTLDSGLTRVKVSGRYQDAQLDIESGHARVPVSPALVQHWGGDYAHHARLASMSVITARIDPVRVNLSTFEPHEAVVAHFETSPLHVSAKVVDTHMRVDQLAGQATWSPKDHQARIAATAQLTLGTTPAPLRMTCTVQPTAGRWDVQGHVGAQDVDLEEWSEALGVALDTPDLWLGDRGKLGVQFSAGSAATPLRVEFSSDAWAGQWRAAYSDDRIVLSAVEPQIHWPRGRLQTLFGQGADVRVKALHDVAWQPRVQAIAIPLGMVTGQPFDPAAIDLRGELVAPALTLGVGEEALTLAAPRLRFTCEDLSDGLHVDVSGRLATGMSAGTDAARLSLKGHLRHVVDSRGVLRLGGATLDVTLSGERLPLHALDRVLQWDGYLTAALGEHALVNVRIDDLSAGGGLGEARFRSTLGSIVVPRLEHYASGFRLPSTPAASAQLRIMKPLRQRLLKRLHPILADIRTSQKPLTARVTGAWLPADGDIAKLVADVEIEIGAVEFEPGIVGLTLLQLGDYDGGDAVPGVIEPIVLTIREGIIEYERFTVHVDEFRLAYTGRVDLNNGQVDLRTEVPLEAVARHAHDLRGYVDGVIVPVVMRGPIERPRTLIDPDFELPGQVLRRGIEKGIEDLIEKNLEDLLGGGSRDDRKRSKKGGRPQ
jgi:hypothetical protein